MTPEDRALYDRLCKMQGKLFKAIGDIESIKISLASGGEMTESKRLVKKTGGAVCYDCGEELIAPADGQPYFCIECSQNRDYERRRQVDG